MKKKCYNKIKITTEVNCKKVKNPTIINKIKILNVLSNLNQNKNISKVKLIYGKRIQKIKTKLSRQKKKKFLPKNNQSKEEKVKKLRYLLNK